MKLDEYFDRIYCINLDKRQDRYAECLDEFNKLDIEVERVSGIDGSITYPWLSPSQAGNKGLLLTQLKILEDAISNGYKNFLLLEDDVMFIENIDELFSNKINELPEDWDMLYLGGNNIFGWGTFNLITGDKSFIPNKQNYKTLNHELCKTTWTQCAHATAFNSKFYLTLLNAINGNLDIPGDMIHCTLQKTNNAYTFLPSLALQRPSFSDIENRIVDYNKINNNLDCF